MSRHRKVRQFGRRGQTGGSREWIGGQVSPPFFIQDREEPYRAEAVFWLEEPSGLIVGHEIIAPEDVEGAVGRVLLTALERPLAGPPRSPQQIRVADPALAAEVRAVVGDKIPVVVAPTPEIDALLESMLESFPGQGGPESYLEGGRISSGVVGALFTAAQSLYRIAPWEVATDNQLLRMDIPALGVEGGCVSIIGRLGESLGVLIFPSLAGYDSFRRAAEKPIPRKGRLDLDTGWLALSFERGADLPASMRREVKAHAWPVAAAGAYPQVERRDPDGASRPLVERDLKIATACAASLSTFFIKHQSLFEGDEGEPVCESYFDRHDLEVRLTMPFEAFPRFDVDAGPARQAAPIAGPTRDRPGRNDPCPCGSGRKYKKCHMSSDEKERSVRGDRDTFHDIDAFLTGELTEFAGARFGGEWRRFAKDFTDAAGAFELSVPWALYHFQVQGETVLDWYLEERGRRLSAKERGCLDAQRAAWLSVWEVSGVEPGASITFRDLLSDETRCVRERTASRTLVVRDAILGRIVDSNGVSFICGLYPRSLPPLEAAEVVRRARGRLRRKRAVPVERLRDEACGRFLIRRWEEAVVQLDARRARPRELQNTDGDPLLLTTDHFEIAPGGRPAVESQLAALEGVQLPDRREDPLVYVFLRPGRSKDLGGGETVVGQAQLSNASLRLETNSRERADALRKRIEAACGKQIRHRAREHADPLSSRAPRPARESGSEELTPEARQHVLEVKQRHYDGWIDCSLPALSGKSPREAVRTRQGRDTVDVLLREMENHEQHSAQGTLFDFSKIRRELHLD